MEQIAFIYGERLVYWSAIVLAMAVLSGVLVFWGACLWKLDSALIPAAGVPLALVLSMVLARLVHWYCRADSYGSFRAAFADVFSGGFALTGVFLGCGAAALLLKVLGLCRNLPALLDCMSLAGCGAIGLGRLSDFFTASNRGQILADMTALPVVYPVVNGASGVLEYRLATFLLQSVWAALVFVILMVVFLRISVPDGDLTGLFFLFYSASQVILDSTRYDSLYLRSNGFVSLVQLLSALILVAAVVYFFRRFLQTSGWKNRYIPVCIGFFALLAGAGYMEYYVQRHGDAAAFAYGVMGLCLAGVVAIGVVLWLLCLGRPLPGKAGEGEIL